MELVKIDRDYYNPSQIEEIQSSVWEVVADWIIPVLMGFSPEAVLAVYEGEKKHALDLRTKVWEKLTSTYKEASRAPECPWANLISTLDLRDVKVSELGLSVVYAVYMALGRDGNKFANRFLVHSLSGIRAKRATPSKSYTWEEVEFADWIMSGDRYRLDRCICDGERTFWGTKIKTSIDRFKYLSEDDKADLIIEWFGTDMLQEIKELNSPGDLGAISDNGALDNLELLSDDLGDEFGYRAELLSAEMHLEKLKAGICPAKYQLSQELSWIRKALTDIGDPKEGRDAYKSAYSYLKIKV